MSQRTFLDGKKPPYASFWGNEIGWSQAGAVQNTWYPISDSDLTTGQIKEVVHDGSGKLTFIKSGRYLCLWSGSFEADAANVHVQIAFMVNGAAIDDSINHLETVGVNRQDPASGNAILNLAPDDTLQVAIRTTDVGAPDLGIDHLNVTINRLEGP